jgi:glycosyltransferase involved in cell wall biosynthesis
MPGWGTTAADRRELAARPNIAMLPNCRHIAEFLSRTRILLMPSLWYEGFGLTVMEAMLHGIPVIASDAGGLVEAKMGTPFVAHTPAIERYTPVFDEHSLPQPVIEPVDLRPWENALRALATDRALYQRVSMASREAALRFAGSLNAGRMPEYLLSLKPGERVPERPSLAHLSGEKRTLLLRMARGRKH